MRILSKILSSSFREIVNSKERTNLRMFAGKATESYIFQNIDKALTKLDIEGWVLYVPYNMRAVNNEKHVHFLVRENYQTLEDEKLLINTFLKIKNAKSDFTKACMLYLNEEASTLKVKVYNKLDTSITEYDSYASFMEEVYGIDIAPYVDELENALDAQAFTNVGFDDTINFLERNGDSLSKLNTLIFDDLFSLIRDGGVKFYQTNLDAIVKENDASFAIVEVKNKTKLPKVIINKSELEIYESIASDINVYFYILMSYNELDTKQNLLVNGFVYGDTELYYYKVDPVEFSLFELTVENGTTCYNIPLNYLKRCNTLLQDSMISSTAQRIPSVLDDRGWIDSKAYAKLSKVLLASELKKANIIQSIFEIEEINKGNSFYIKINGKKIAIKYVKNLSWRMLITGKEYETFVRDGVDYVLVLKLFKEGESNELISIIGYIPLPEIPVRANVVGNVDGITTNKVFWDFIKKPQAEKDTLISKSGVSYILSINETDARYEGAKPFYKMPQFSKASIKDFS